MKLSIMNLFNNIRIALALGLMALTLPLSQAQRIEARDAPAKDFTLPLFGESGYKAWEIAGHEGRYIDKDHILVTLMNIKIFSGEADMFLDAIIASPDAKIDLKDKNAQGESAIIMRSHNYRVSGQGWTWFAKENRIRVHKNAKVEFKQDIGIELN